MLLSFLKVALAKVVDDNGHQGLVLAYNPSEDVRSPLVLAYSLDGFSWTVFAYLEKPSTVSGRWYAYPTLVQHGGMIYCSYTVYDHLEAQGRNSVSAGTLWPGS